MACVRKYPRSQRVMFTIGNVLPDISGEIGELIITVIRHSHAPAAGMPRAKAAVTRALELEPGLGEARATLGCIRSFYDWDWAGAERECRAR